MQSLLMLCAQKVMYLIRLYRCTINIKDYLTFMNSGGRLSKIPITGLLEPYKRDEFKGFHIDFLKKYQL